MKKILLFSLICYTQLLMAQFPGGGGGGGERRSQGGYNQMGGMGQQQAKGIGKITGIILDSTTSKGVEFANIALYNKATNKLIDGTIADEKGKFTIEGLVDGTYKLQISFLGYGNKIVDDVKIVREKTINLGNVQLSESNNTLQEVTVTGQKALIEEKVDRLVYNAEKDILAKGGDAADVLRKVPLLQVDLDGNVSVRGSSNIKVLINGKPSTIVASSIADAVKMIPADMIKTVEVITSPSSKYDAEGAAGIVNIITKKDKLQGYNMNVDLGAGLRGSNLGLNGSIRAGKFGLRLGGYGRAMYNDIETNNEQFTTVKNIQSRTSQKSLGSDLGGFAHYSMGMDYDIDKTQSLSGGIRYGLRAMNRDQTQSTDLFTENILKGKTIRDISSVNNSHNYDINLDYLLTPKAQTEFSISTQYSRNDMVNDFNSNFVNDNGLILSRLKNVNANLNQEITLQSDYQTPIKDNQMLEFGGKGILRTVNSDFQYLSASDANTEYTIDYKQPSGKLDYGQNIVSGYTSYTISTPSKVTFKVGARLEHTAIEATQDGKDINIPDYSNLVPSVNISKPLKGSTTIKLGYNQRIQRPGLQQLNPNISLLNTQDVTQGNPALRPELTNNLELGLSTTIKKTYVNASFFGRLTNNAINQVRRPIDTLAGALLTTYENIGKQQGFGTNVFANVYLTNTWSINGGIDLYYTFLEGQTTGIDGKSLTAKNSGINYGGRLMTQIQLKNGWGFQAFTYMRGVEVQLQGSRGGWGTYALGAKKDFNNKKGSLGLGIENFAARGWNIRSEFVSPQFTQVSNNLMLNRNVKINFTYKLGKVTFTDSRKKTKSVNNDDVKGDGGGGGDMGGGQGGASQGGGARPQGGAPQQGARPAGAGQPQQGQGSGQPQQGGAPNMQGRPQSQDTTKGQRPNWNGQRPQGSEGKPQGEKPKGEAPSDKKQDTPATTPKKNEGGK
jgi:ferric enterobactin receptor